jgi:glycosyltransferase involved in cell wall biosynthesis
MIIGFTSADFLRSDKNESGLDQWGGSGWARCGQYIPYIRAAGHDVVVGTLWDHEGTLAVEDGEGRMAYPDIIVSQRLMHKDLDKSYKAGRAAGQIIVNDVDDWYWGLSPANDAFYYTHPKYNLTENTTFYRASLNASSYLTVSTPYLYQRLRDWAKGRVTVLQNYVDVSRFTPVTMTDTIVPEVGWAGSTSHRSGDIEVLSGVLKPMAERERIRLVHAGAWDYSPSYASKLGVPEELITRTNPRTGHEDYPTILDFEVGVVPLRNNPFNEAKSDIKGLEYAAAGIPFVASMMPAYKQLFGSWTNDYSTTGFFLAKNGADWSRNLERLRSPEARKIFQAALLENVKQRDIAIGAQEYIQYLESLTPR